MSPMAVTLPHSPDTVRTKSILNHPAPRVLVVSHRLVSRTSPPAPAGTEVRMQKNNLPARAVDTTFCSMVGEEDTETLTIRIPRTLKSTVEQAARARAMSITGVVRQALQETVRPPGKLYQHPAYSPTFNDFLKEAGRRKVLILVVEERSGHRYFFEGAVDLDLSNDSLIAIRRAKDTPWIILRRDIVAWFGGVPGDLNRLAMALTRQGWAARSTDS